MSPNLKLLITSWLNLSLLSLPFVCQAMEHPLNERKLPLSPHKSVQKPEKHHKHRKSPRGVQHSLPLVKFISTPREHHDLLKDALSTTRRRLVISSPVISETFLRGHFLEWLKNTHRNLIITIYTNEKGAYKLSELINQKESDKADPLIIIKTTNNCPSKLVIGDNKILVTGAFNWLGNVKDRKQLYLSTVLEGKGVKQPIREALKLLDMNLCSERDDSLQAAIAVKLSELSEDNSHMRTKRPLSITNDTLKLAEAGEAPNQKD